MKRRIYLFRHAKSGRDDPTLPDRERDLNGRGREASERMGAWCAENGIAPELVLCSTARRARETLARLLPHLHTGRVEFEDALYLASAAELLRRLRRIDDCVASVMMVGHNPGLHELAVLLAADGEAGPVKQLSAKFPTAAMAEITVELDRWRDLDAERGRLARFVLPRELA
ncbi:MAG: histidine phosphatase family protein [Alphaproteobacteria bacterium]|nr:histidine phosphatase family protein [Alphaproteobacteria bacterium]